MHITSNDVFISMEMSIRNEERGKVEKDRKIRQQLQATEDKALALLEQGKPVNSLSVASGRSARVASGAKEEGCKKG